MKEVRILSPNGMLGYGFPKRSFAEGMKRKPHAICVDAGSTDGGPQKLGAGVGITSRAMVKQDLEVMISAGLNAGIPVLIGSAGGSGGARHIAWTMEIIQDLVHLHGWKLNVAVIHSTIDKQWIKKQVAEHRVRSLPGVPELTDKEVDAATEIVAQMGYESFLPALESGTNVIVGGRAYDPAMTAAVCVHYGMDEGLAYHMGKILECGALCAIPGSAKDCLLGTIRKDSFTVEAMNSERKCLTESVAAHTLYEKSHPYLLPGPGGTANLQMCEFIQESEGIVKVVGSRFERSEEYRVKLEGAKESGYRTIFVAGIRDPQAIKQIDEILRAADTVIAEHFPHATRRNGYVWDYKVYGRNGVMGQLEPKCGEVGHEICLVAEFLAPTQEEASALCSLARSTMLHYHYRGRYATAGNFAFPFAPSDFEVGKAYEFNVYHTVPISDPRTFFPTEYITLG